MPPNPSPLSTELLRPGERVRVALVTDNPPQWTGLAGTIAGTDEYGILIDLDSGSSVFIPWNNVATVTKLPA